MDNNVGRSGIVKSDNNWYNNKHAIITDDVTLFGVRVYSVRVNNVYFAVKAIDFKIDD